MVVIMRLMTALSAFAAAAILLDASNAVVVPLLGAAARSQIERGQSQPSVATLFALAESLDGLLEALTGRVMVAHVASIEQRFLGAAFAEYGVSLINPVVDTAALAAERAAARAPRRARASAAAGTR
jgi:transcriptional regulator with XRE-family HTH domain